MDTAKASSPSRSRTPRPDLVSIPRAAVAGVVAGGVGLGVAELVSGLSRRLQSPVLDVGDRFIDAVPAWLKNLAIDLFGTNDKIALLSGIGATLAIYSAVMGVLWLRGRRTMAIVGIAAFGAVGAWAASNARSGAPWFAVLPSLVGAAIVAAILAAFAAQVTISADAAGAAKDSRRSFIGLAGGLAVVAVAATWGGRALRARFSAASSRDAVAAITGSGNTPVAAPTQLAPIDGIKPFFTPNQDFYRIDTALSIPQVPIDTWSLKIHGMVDKELELTFDQLVERPLVEADITLTCVSNEIGGGLLGTARWVGVRLDDLLAEAGIATGADQVVGRSVDGYTCGFPVAALDGRDALIAIAMNGEPLPLAHGFPARLIVPGLYGYVSATKWLTEIELTRFDDFDQYWVPRGWDNVAPIKTQSRIDTPRPLTTVDAGTVAIGGTAWAQTRGIAKVEVQIDDGPWAEATLADELNSVTWRQWSHAWDAEPGRHTITVRATDNDGETQTETRSSPMPNGATGQHQVVVMVA